MSVLATSPSYNTLSTCGRPFFFTSTSAYTRNDLRVMGGIIGELSNSLIGKLCANARFTTDQATASRLLYAQNHHRHRAYIEVIVDPRCKMIVHTKERTHTTHSRMDRARPYHDSFRMPCPVRSPFTSTDDFVQSCKYKQNNSVV